MTAANYYPLSVAEVIRETADAHSVVFDVPAELAERFRYRPGQFLTLRIPFGEKALARCYSLCSAPGVDAALKVTIKRVDGGRGSNWICDHLKPGDTVEVMRPAGVFTPKELAGEFWLFAGGSGITPVFSILKSVVTQGQGQVRLVYANRDEASVIFSEQLKQLVAEYPDRLSVMHWLDSVQGWITPRQLSRWLPWSQELDPECFICGPGPFMDCAATALELLGVPRKRVHIERFVSLEEGEESAADHSDQAATGEVVQIEVELDGQVHRVAGSTAEPILDSLLNAGLDAPFSCRTGGCAACMCHLQEGEATMLRNEVLDEDDQAAGWVLGCQAVPVSNKVKVSFPG